MAQRTTAFGIIGLGQIGGNLARQALEEGLHVVGHDQSAPTDDLREKGLEYIDCVDGFRTALVAPRVVFLYVPAGPVVDTVIEQLAEQLEPGDIIVDGGNSYWGDSKKRHQRLAERNLQFVDLGTSGGIEGARNDACFMAGGEPAAIQVVQPLLEQLCVPGGFVHTGRPGTGHFVKLVHNGIEFGMLQAIGEGMELLSRFDEPLDMPEILRCWSNGSVIRSWLIELMEEVLREKGSLESVPAFIEDTGEVNWLVSDALQREIPIPVISQSVMQLFASRDNQQNRWRAIAMMRHGFGGHPFGTDSHIAEEREEGRLGPVVRPAEKG